MPPAICAPQQFDVFLNTNSNDSLSNDRPGSRTSSTHNRLNLARLRQPSRKDNASTSKVASNEDGSRTNEITNNNESMPSTSKTITSIFFNNCKFSDQSTSAVNASKLVAAPSTNFAEANIKEPSSSTSTSQQDRETIEDQILDDPTHMVVGPTDDDDNWEDCEEGSEEEICTCHDYSPVFRGKKILKFRIQIIFVQI